MSSMLLLGCSNPLGSGAQVSSGATSSIATYGSTRYWADGTYANSCNAYINPSAGYAYAGSTGSGTYRINPGGLIVDAYCDMTSNGGGWTLNFDGSLTVALHNIATTQWINQTINTNATEVMVYLSSSATGYPAATTKYKFAKPAGFDIYTNHSSTVSLIVTNLSNSAASTASTLIYGSDNFATLTCDAWAGGNWGRFGMCVGGGDAANFNGFPYFNGYNGTQSYCNFSNQAYNVTACSSSNFLVIFER